MEPARDRTQLPDIAGQRAGVGSDAVIGALGVALSNDAREGLAEIVESGQRMAPAVSRVLDELLKQAESGDLAGGAQVLDPAGEPRDVAEAGPAREKVQDFQLRIDAALRPSDRLQDQPPVEDDRGIALLSRDATGGGRLVHGRRRVGRQGVTREATGPPGKLPLGRDGGEKLPAEARVDMSVDERAALEKARHVGGGDVAGGAGGQRRVVALTVHAQEEEQDVGHEDRPVFHLHGVDAVRLGGKPALAGEEVLEAIPPLPFEEVHHRLGLRE